MIARAVLRSGVHGDGRLLVLERFAADARAARLADEIDRRLRAHETEARRRVARDELDGCLELRPDVRRDALRQAHGLPKREPGGGGKSESSG
jgi:hypothetical protein